MSLDQIYTEIITEHNKSSHNKHPVQGANIVRMGVNPSCGDEIRLELRERDGYIEDAGFTGTGCAISQASASIMIDLIRGQKTERALELTDLFFDMIKNKVEDEDQLEPLDEALALRNISRMPARVKCAVLAWHTLEEAIGHDSTAENT